MRIVSLGGALFLAFFALPGSVVAQQAGESELFLGDRPAGDDAGEAAGGDTGRDASSDGLAARGVLEASAEATISSELAARVESLPFTDGMRFAEGDILVAFDCALFEARRAQALAQLQAARTKLENAQQLQSTNAIGELDVRLAQAEVRRTGAAVAEAGVAVERCQIAAPFDGRVVETFVNAHEVAAPGAELLAIVSSGALEATLLVPSDWLVWLEPETPFAFTVDETGETLEGTVETLGARVDPVSQTVPVRVVLDARAGLTELIPGMSGTARFQQAPVQGGDG